MNPVDFEYLRKLLRERSGLMLSADKQYLLESRLLPIARRIGAGGLAELTQRLRTARSARVCCRRRVLLLPLARRMYCCASLTCMSHLSTLTRRGCESARPSADSSSWRQMRVR